MSELRLFGPDVKRSGLLYDLAFSLGQSFLHQKILRPGWVRHLHAISIRPTQILVKSPGESSIPQMDQPDFSQCFKSIFSKRPIDLNIDHDCHLAIVRRGKVNKLMRRSSHGRGFEIESSSEVD